MIWACLDNLPAFDLTLVCNICLENDSGHLVFPVLLNRVGSDEFPHTVFIELPKECCILISNLSSHLVLTS